MRYKNSGFTLIELLVVISIISLLSSIVLTSVNSARAKARDARRIADFKQIQLALELFYDQAGRYPSANGAATWDEQWASFSACLETGVCNGFTVANFISPISKVPNDPLNASGVFDDGRVYYYAWPPACGTGEAYRLAVVFETNHSALQSDVDGSYYNNNLGCVDNATNYHYCVGVGTCSGW